MNIENLLTNFHHYPELKEIHSLNILGEGFGSLVVETDTGIVLRIAKNHISQKNHVFEKEALEFIGDKIKDTEIPKIVVYKESDQNFPFGFIGHKKIEGIPLSPEMVEESNFSYLAEQIARFLFNLHGIKVPSSFRKSEFPLSETSLTSLWNNISGYIKDRVNVVDFIALQNWIQKTILQIKELSFTPTLIHGDFWNENIIVDKSSLEIRGVIDFENTCLGYKLLDFMTLSYISREFMHEVIRFYIKNGGNIETNEIDENIDLLLGIGELVGLKYGIESNFVDSDAMEKVLSIVI